MRIKSYQRVVFLSPTNAGTRQIEEVSELIYEAFLTNEDGRIYSNYEDTSDFIKYLVREEIDFSILTNSDPKIMNALPKGLEELLTWNVDEDAASGPSRRSKIFTSYDLGVTKPDKQVWASVISILGLSQANDRFIHIGDDFEECANYSLLGCCVFNLDEMYHCYEVHSNAFMPAADFSI